MGEFEDQTNDKSHYYACHAVREDTKVAHSLIKHVVYVNPVIKFIWVTVLTVLIVEVESII